MRKQFFSLPFSRETTNNFSGQHLLLGISELLSFDFSQVLTEGAVELDDLGVVFCLPSSFTSLSQIGDFDFPFVG